MIYITMQSNMIDLPPLPPASVFSGNGITLQNVCVCVCKMRDGEREREGGREGEGS
jgi:hypothetical protein